MRFGVIHVLTAVITAEGESKMTTSISEETGTAQATVAAAPPKATKKANVAKRARHVAPAKAKSARKATPKIAAVASTAPMGTGPMCQSHRLTVTSVLFRTPTTNSTPKKKKTTR